VRSLEPRVTYTSFPHSWTRTSSMCPSGIAPFSVRAAALWRSLSSLPDGVSATQSGAKSANAASMSPSANRV
jgi:hypothetical protein